MKWRDLVGSLYQINAMINNAISNWFSTAVAVKLPEDLLIWVHMQHLTIWSWFSHNPEIVGILMKVTLVMIIWFNLLSRCNSSRKLLNKSLEDILMKLKTLQIGAWMSRSKEWKFIWKNMQMAQAAWPFSCKVPRDLQPRLLPSPPWPCSHNEKMYWR